VALILSAPEGERDKVLAEFTAPTRTRVERLGSHLDAIVHVPHEVAAIASALRAEQAHGRSLIIVAGVSAIMDRDDVVPKALRDAGGTVTHFGVPVDPGSLLMLGHLGNMPVVGAPTCARSLQTNVMDWILPRLLAGERLTRADLIMMGHGGLLEDIGDRPVPRFDSGQEHEPVMTPPSVK
jgi:molybdenum cofactor cytidylyltransferase